jgi:hypothetical protein
MSLEDVGQFVDYGLVHKVEMGWLTNVTVVRSEPSQQQHKLLRGILQMEDCGRTKEKKELFVSKCKLWKLKEPGIWQAFEAEVRERSAHRTDGDGDVEVMRRGLKECLLEVSARFVVKLLGQRHSET